MAISNAHVMEELFNLVANRPVFPGDTISHGCAEECVERGWARRDKDGSFRPTKVGKQALAEWVQR